MMSCYIEQEHDGCKNCQYEDRGENEYPCAVCVHNYQCMWKPKEDKVAVVRCRNCKHWEDDYCTKLDNAVLPSNYCCWGESE